MKVIREIAAALVFGVVLPVAQAAPEPQSQVVFSASAGGLWEGVWEGLAARTYFMQASTDLAGWSYLPDIKFGTGIHTSGGANTDVPKFFFRLKYVDENWVDSLQDARDADFDADSIPNWFEVEEIGSDPLNGSSNGGDSDNDGLPDGWELYHFNGLGVADPNAKLTPEGLTNKEKSELGLGPFGDDLSLSSERITYEYDGDRLETVDYYTQREFGYGLDGNGNVEAVTTD